MQRCFIAFELAEDARQSLRRSLEPISKSQPEKPRLVDPSVYHVTLKFLGSIRHGTRQAIELALTPALAGVRAVETRWAGFGGLPRRAKAHVLCAVLADDAGELAALYARVERVCVDAAVPADERGFKPHATLARFHKAVDLRPYLGLGSPPSKPVVLTSVALYESVLAPGGAKYSVLSRYELDATADSVR